jgi:transcriptional regulator with XRE-family HTH domain
MTGSLNRNLQNPKYRVEFERGQRFFRLEVQILLALEDKGWSYEDLAKATGIPERTIWRDIKNGELQKASLDQVARIAEALGLHMHPILMTPEQEKEFLPSLRKLKAA